MEQIGFGEGAVAGNLLVVDRDPLLRKESECFARSTM